MNNAPDVDAYIKSYPKETQAILEKIRATVRAVAPDSAERMAYGIPTLSLRGNLVHYGAYEHHIGFYPGSGPIAAFKDKLAGYKTSKGTVQFPLDKPIPYDLIRAITTYCVEQRKAK